MSVDAKLVKTLRERTGAGMMDCKKALVEAKRLDAAVDHLRKKPSKLQKNQLELLMKALFSHIFILEAN